jgi:hypothetical protein
MRKNLMIISLAKTTHFDLLTHSRKHIRTKFGGFGHSTNKSKSLRKIILIGELLKSSRKMKRIRYHFRCIELIGPRGAIINLLSHLISPNHGWFLVAYCKILLFSQNHGFKMPIWRSYGLVIYINVSSKEMSESQKNWKLPMSCFCSNLVIPGQLDTRNTRKLQFWDKQSSIWGNDDRIHPYRVK